LLQRIGRITGRLPKQLADEVVGALMELFSPIESESAWHGGELFLTAIAKEQLINAIYYNSLAVFLQTCHNILHNFDHYYPSQGGRVHIDA